ncbi:prepilin-type N-terminal cleavage/methylation domain-containing protein, partial [Myxococcota bacterium]|nr:prepilin-type N-terminal cleavage/methylation domain-containing protein [Myxococcota bacterium]
MKRTGFTLVELMV